MEVNGNYKFLESLVLLTGDLYQKVYDKSEAYDVAVSRMIEYAVRFEEELDWKENDERNYLFELEKFEQKVLEELEDELE